MLVTGPARGLGRASTLACAAAGADIVLGLRDKAQRRRPGRRDRADGAQGAAAAARRHQDGPDQGRPWRGRSTAFGRIDILLNNVGVGPENPAEKVTEADFDFTLNANLKGTFFVTQAVGEDHDRSARRAGSST